MSKSLHWSRKGEIACEAHAPAAGSPRWNDEGWQLITPAASRRITYQCQHCGNRAIQHQSRTPPGQPLILNVDDRPASLYARDRMLRLHGFTVTNADCGRAAVDVARQLRPSLILLDVHLPDIDGRDLCRQVKTDVELAHIPVLLISATLRGASPSEVLEQTEAAGFIAEPVDGASLAGTIRRVLNGNA